MAEPAESSAGPVRSNPLYHDPVLLQMYVEALDDVLAEAEVRAALEEFDLIPATVRNKMVSEAALVLGSAPQEYENYRQAASSEVSRSYTLPWPSRDPRAHTRAVRQLWAITAALGALITACGITVLITGPLAQPWLSVGITVITVAAAVWSARLALSTRFAADLFSGRIDAGPPWLAEARRDLMAAVGGTELLALVRTNINASRRRRFGQAFTVISSPGLSEVYDSANRVPTDAAAELASLIDRLDGTSIAVAGPRGSGKSTLLREYCEDDDQAAVERTRFEWASLWSTPSPRAGRGDLRCLVAAPVDYVARDFVLYMFGTFCRAVVASFGTRVRELPRTALIAAWLIRRRRLIWAWSWRLALAAWAVAMIFWERPVARWLPAPLSWVQDLCIAMLGAVAVSVAWAVARRSGRRRRQIWQLRSVRGPREKDLAAQARCTWPVSATCRLTRPAGRGRSICPAELWKDSDRAASRVLSSRSVTRRSSTTSAGLPRWWPRRPIAGVTGFSLASTNSTKSALRIKLSGSSMRSRASSGFRTSTSWCRYPTTR